MLAQVLLVIYTFGLCVATQITVGDQLERICTFIDNATDGTYVYFSQIIQQLYYQITEEFCVPSI